MQNTPILIEVKKIILPLLDITNPVALSIIILLIVFFVITIAMRNSILPWQKKIEQEKSALEASNLRLMAIFAELDPDPILRVDQTGKIIFTNPAAEKCGLGELYGKPITDIITILKIDLVALIKNNQDFDFNFCFKEKHYSVFVKGISYLNIAQFYLHDITDLKKREEELSVSQAELKEFSKYLQQKIEEERKRIARELHDDIGQKMVFLKLNLHSAFSKVTEREDSPEMLRNFRVLDGIACDIRAIAHSLIPGTIEEVGLYSSLINLVEGFDLQSQIKGKIEFNDSEERMDINLEISIYRIVQEALNNILKYSKANEYNIEIKRKDNNLRIIISDDGVGFDIKSKRNKGMGLRNMKERAEMHKGTFKVISSPMQGTVIMINFPVGDRT